jgi:demethylsterigmatocystin 6-O-methyltransferase
MYCVRPPANGHGTAKGASVYHFRQILHDWPDEDCVRLLRLTARAMTKQSTLLIDEVVMPEQGAHWMVTQRDLTMLALFNAGERSKEEWRDLLGKAGLILEEIRTYDERMAASLLVVKLP